MTTIAWDGKTLATDSRMCGNTIRSEKAQKLWYIDGQWVAVSGAYDDAMAFIEWFKDGRHKDRKPSIPRDDGFAALVLRGRRIFRYEAGCRPWKVKAQFVAAGSGMEFALGAMAAGADARRAVRIAARFDPGTNRKVQASA